VTPTPGGILAKELRKREEELNRNSQNRIQIESEDKGHFGKQKSVQKNPNVPRKPAPCVQKANLLSPV
jgi:hypothetical protein